MYMRGQIYLPCQKTYENHKSTVDYLVVKIWLQVLEDFGAKTGRFTTVNMAKIDLHCSLLIIQAWIYLFIWGK